MALRDRQISGIPLTKSQAMVMALFMTALVPVLSYGVWFRTFLSWIPEELRMTIVIVGMITHLTLSVERVPNNVERNLLWFGAYTGESFPNGICLLPRLPVPFVLLILRLVLSEEVYQKILWSLGSEVKIHSIIRPFVAEGLALGGVRARITGFLRLEVEVGATYSSQEDEERVAQAVVAEYVAGIKSSVIAQHSPEDLMRGYHTGGSEALLAWMTDAWKLVGTYGVSLGSVTIGTVEIMSKQVEHAFDRTQSKETFIAGAKSLAETYAAFKETLPPGTSEEVALMMFNMDRVDNGQAPVNFSILKFK
ncbi:MAG: hypothetical protein ACAH17_03170 [Candidatus Paceibacterota bacterium]